MRWRTMLIDGKCFRYHIGRGTIVIKTPAGATYMPKIETVKRVTPDVFERGQWKKTEDGMVKPGDVKRYIEESILGRSAV